MTAVFVPERSNAQRFEALEKANRIRIGRADRKRLLTAGQLDVAAILDEPDEFWAGCKVEDFLVCLRGLGKQAARRITLSAGVSPAKTLGGMTLRQRRALYDALIKYGPQTRKRFS